jgi:tetratricopeptide (TPR) repeat protein
VPNACGECHRDLPPERLEQAIAGWWPGAAARQARRIRLADAFGAESETPDRQALAAVVADGGEAPTLRGAAALWLAMRFPREAAGPIARALADPSLVLKQRLAAALAIAPSREGVDALRPSLQDPSLAVRAAAALALGTLGTPEGEVAVRGLATDPASAGLVRPHVLLAAMARRRGNLPEVAVELERALDLQPYSAEVLLQIADVQVRQGNWPAARASLEEALRFDPQNRDALEGLAAAASRGH